MGKELVQLDMGDFSLELNLEYKDALHFAELMNEFQELISIVDLSNTDIVQLELFVNRCNKYKKKYSDELSKFVESNADEKDKLEKIRKYLDEWISDCTVSALESIKVLNAVSESSIEYDEDTSTITIG